MNQVCLFILKVTFKDLDNNGQVLKGLDTLTKRIKCAEMGFDVHGKSLIYTEILEIKSQYLTMYRGYSVFLNVYDSYLIE